MKLMPICLITLIIIFTDTVSLYPQKLQNVVYQITASELESHVTFLASPLLKGRKNGEEGLEIAANYIESQAKLLKLRPGMGNGYFQPFKVMKRKIDQKNIKSFAIINGRDTTLIREPSYKLVSNEPNSPVNKKEALSTHTDIRELNNIIGYIEGTDPVLKHEAVIFSAHYDHIGSHEGKIAAGADDDASGCSALLSIAEAFQSLEKKPLRSILFLWFSGEEIGLFGSEIYVRNPVFPLEKTVVDLNLDMIGREKGAADSTSETPMTDHGKVFVITDSQSKELSVIAEETDRNNQLDFDYTLSGIDHPLQLFARSDHFNFVVKDIPVLCFTTGIHSDYHTSGDIVEKINFKKMEMITRCVFEIGLAIANLETRLIVDNPYSSWGKSR